MRLEDIATVRALEGRTPEAPHWDHKVYEGFVHTADTAESVSRAAWVATEMAELAGFAVAKRILDVCELESIAVDERARRRGVGRRLLDAVIAWARSEGARRVQLEVRSGSVAAIRLYERAGLRAEGRRRAYYRHPEEDAVLMGLDLRNAGDL